MKDGHIQTPELKLVDNQSGEWAYWKNLDKCTAEPSMVVKAKELSGGELKLEAGQ